MVRLILTEEKPKERKFTMKSDKIGKYKEKRTKDVDTSRMGVN